MDAAIGIRAIVLRGRCGACHILSVTRAYHGGCCQRVNAKASAMDRRDTCLLLEWRERRPPLSFQRPRSPLLALGTRAAADCALTFANSEAGFHCGHSRLFARRSPIA